jgi:hypothetical protein
MVYWCVKKASVGRYHLELTYDGDFSRNTTLLLTPTVARRGTMTLRRMIAVRSCYREEKMEQLPRYCKNPIQ